VVSPHITTQVLRGDWKPFLKVVVVVVVVVEEEEEEERCTNPETESCGVVVRFLHIQGFRCL
jgi:hypothetical protein